MRILLALLLTSCAVSAKTPLPNFATVEKSLFRGGQPTAEGVHQLALKGVKSIIKLNTENQDEEEQAAKDNGIKIYYRPLSGIFAPDEKTENEIQILMSLPTLRPLYIHCELGKDRTGLAVALHRVSQDEWTPDQAHKEWMALGHSIFLFPMDHYFWEAVKK